MSDEIPPNPMTPELQQRIEYFTAAALSGLCANPAYSTVDSNRFLKMKKLTLEKIAVLSAMNVIEELEILKEVRATGKAPVRETGTILTFEK